MITIYKISFPDGIVYIGSTSNYINRIACHKYRAGKKSLPSGVDCKLYKKFRQIGFDKKWFSIVDVVSEKDRYEMEDFYISKHWGKCLNSSKTSRTPCLGVKRDSDVVKRSIKTRLAKMPYFLVTQISTGKRVGIFKYYNDAAFFTKESKDSIRKKLRNNRPSYKYKYEYIGGGL